MVGVAFCWSPENGIGICTVSGHQTEPQMVSDGFGGAVIAWVDGRNNGGTTDIYAQRIDSYGEKLWAQNGIPICTASNTQKFNNAEEGNVYIKPNTIIADGYGNYIITWEDNRNGNWDIYAQKITSQGSTLWALNGIAVCTVSANQRYPVLTSDGLGGAIITWEDWRNEYSNPTSESDIYIQRINSEGNPMWTPGGVSVCTSIYMQKKQELISDGNGGAIIVWADYRVPFVVPIEPYPVSYDANPNVYAQRIDNTGNALWINNGIPITHNNAELDEQNTPQIISDGFGGAFISSAHSIGIFWEPAVTNIIRINSLGSTLWSCSIMTSDMHLAGIPVIISDENNGIIVAVDDYLNNYDVYAGRVYSSGTSLWNINGITICTSENEQTESRIISDGIGGAIITWYDRRNGYADIYAQRINSGGVNLWTINGVAVCTANYDQVYPKIVSDLANGAIIVWDDYRNGIDSDIYAQRVYSSGYVISPVNVPKELWDFEP